MKKKTDLLKWKQDLDDEFKHLISRMKEHKKEMVVDKKKSKIPIWVPKIVLLIFFMGSFSFIMDMIDVWDEGIFVILIIFALAVACGCSYGLITEKIK